VRSPHDGGTASSLFERLKVKLRKLQVWGSRGAESMYPHTSPVRQSRLPRHIYIGWGMPASGMSRSTRPVPVELPVISAGQDFQKDYITRRDLRVLD